MRIRSGILTGTALGLLMAAAPAGSAALANAPRLSMGHERAVGAPVVLAQANDEDRREKRERRQEKAKQKDDDKQSGEEKPAKRARSDRGEEQQKQAEEKAETRQKVKKEQAEKAAGGEPERRERKSDAAAQRGETAEQPEPRKAEPKRAEKEPAGEKQQKRAEKKQQQKQEAEQAEQRRDQRAKPERGEAAGAPEADRAQDADRAKEKARAKDGEPSDRQERAKQDGKRDAAREQDQKQERRDAKSEAERGDEGEKRSERRDRDEKAAETPERRESGSDAQAQRGEALPENAAPVLDSQKRAAGNDEQRERSRDGDRRQRKDGEARDEDGERDGRGRDRDRRENARDMPLPDSDRAAQRDLKREEFRSLTAEKGKRIDREDWRERDRHERRDGADVIKEFGDRFVLQLNDRRIVQSSDQERMRHRSRDVYYEELPRDRTREVIVRDNGFKVVTIRDRYGDIIRRSRIAPDGQEYVLVYASDRGERRGGWNDWRDPGRDLPPLNLTIPASEYILEAERVQDPDVYYQFLEEPPVEPVQQLYSLDDVKYSARIRDMVRRIDLDTINFEFGSASVNEAEVNKLESVADAMGRLLDNNPGETFLIEGHTDAVGSDVSNLALSDERASSVASALTDVFGIPPENLVTQGYGEQYLKIETEDRERENRRVAIRRITPLVTPVASAQ